MPGEYMPPNEHILAASQPHKYSLSESFPAWNAGAMVTQALLGPAALYGGGAK